MPTATESAVAKAGLLNGALPAHPPATPEGTAFWTGYALAPAAPSGTVQSRYLAAFRAGRRRKRVEPGINTATDPRAKLPPVPRIRF